ncbi:class I adenylate-forming enzyme family protein [Halobellus clavatus]|jgi:long-chain acyl-CoA synthetase|uniref:Acyl-CoA synthetase (AMP-forming)/AMP-acid ligase II n=1 Tax=Halobellus clavatus TaxID=660517 RepID=A0A1H3DCU6_9EURY|nr:class I adenylate-forming enzyme family protein [Halobellus clavatus]SDX64196.1 Acyl-CoA synthetase (AMP-forming)/AMP-acid ligase II [Halobellus clavatus]
MHTTARVDLPSLRELSSLAAESNPSGEAFADGVDGRSITWDAFDERSARAANALREHVGQGDRVAFVCEGSVDHVTLWNGGLKAGCLVSNLHVRSSPETMRDCIDRLRPRVVVLDEEFSEFFEERVYGDITTDLDAVITTGDPRADYETSIESALAGQPATEPDVRSREEDLVSVVWTSGTTGQPKGWCLSNRAAVLRGVKLMGALNISRTTRRVQVLSPSFAAWFTGTVPAMLTASATCFLRTWDPETYLRVIDEREQTMATLVPTMWREVLDLDAFGAYDLGSLERITAAGEQLDATTLERLRDHVCERVYNAYAATEMMVTSISEREMDDERIGSVGKPAVGTQVRIVPEGGPPDAEQPPGEVGEVIVKGPDCPLWAWGDTETTEAAFEDGWWYSGDLGYKDDEGYLFLEGRSDFVILSKGIKISPVPIEERLDAHPDVEASAVVGVDDEEYGEKVTAVVHRGDPELTAAELDEWCLESDELARYERPRAYHFRDEPLPRTATNKLDRQGARSTIE